MTPVVRERSTVMPGAKIGTVDSTGIARHISAQRTFEVQKKQRFERGNPGGLEEFKM